MSAVADLLTQLVRIPSVNPEGDPGTDRTGEAECAKFIADFLTSLGAEVQLPEILPGRPNVIGRFPSDRPGKPRLLFAPHTDTVSVLGMTIEPFSGEQRDGRIWGRGSSDTKGPMAAMLQALSDLRDVIPALSHEIWFAGLMSEEAGQHGSISLASSESFDFVLVGEPTSLQIVHTHKGSRRIFLHATGVAVHSSTPDKGKNAIEPVLDALVFLKAEFHRRFGDLTHPILGRTTMSIGTIRGGSKVNIVPEGCDAAVDIRTLPGQDIDGFIADLKERFPEVTFTTAGAAPLWTDPENAIIQKLRDCGAGLTGAPWFCDAAPFSERGVAAVALGPGSIAQAHTADEWIAIADLEAGLTFYKNFLNQLA